MTHTPHLAFLLPVLLLPPPDEGWDFMVLDMPHQVVLGDDLVFSARCRPGNPYAVYGDLFSGLQFFPPLRVHLQGSPALFTAASGTMPPGGSQQHRIRVPDLPGLHGIDLHFQAFCIDGSIRGGLGASDSKTVTLLQERGQPLIELLTVNRIPRDFNGSEPNEGRLQVPPTGFTVDVFFDDRGQGPIDPGSLVVTADRALGAGAVPAGTDLSPFLTVGPHSATGIVDSRWAFPAGATVSLTARVANTAGVTSPPATFTADSVNFTQFNRPFARTQIWFVDFDRHDLDASGVPDFREDLLLFGLGSDPRDMSGPSFRIDQAARQAILALLRAHFRVGQPDGVRVDFFASNPGGTFATICVGGLNPIPANQLPPGALVTTGAAFLNSHNRLGRKGNDTLQGRAGEDDLRGGAGDDLIDGEEGDDTLQGNAGNDRLIGGEGNDTLLGGSGHDALQGRWGDDSLSGGTGNDTLDGQQGSDTLDGGDGDDTLLLGANDAGRGGAGQDAFTVTLDETPGMVVVEDFDPDEDRMIVQYDAANTPPVVDVQQDGDHSYITVDGVRLAEIRNIGDRLDPADIALIGAG